MTHTKTASFLLAALMVTALGVGSANAQMTTSTSTSTSTTTNGTTDSTGGAIYTNTTVTPGLPNTGAGGDAAMNVAAILAAAVAAGAGAVYLRRRAHAA